MLEENKNIESDIMMRSILTQAQEEVPGHVWEGISSELERIETAKTRKPIVLWVRRASIAVAAAAVVAVGLFTDRNSSEDIIQVSANEEGLVAVEHLLVADAAKDVEMAKTIYKKENQTVYYDHLQPQETDSQVVLNIDTKETQTADAQKTQIVDVREENISDIQTDETVEYFPETWPEDEQTKKNKKRTSLTLSGVAGTNSTQGDPSSPLRRPQMSTAKPKTGITQKSMDSTYGLPMSLGAGVKIDFNDRWALGIGGNYTILTRKFYGTYTQVSPEGNIEQSTTSDVRNIQQYIGVPINAFYNIINKEHVNFYVYAGGTAEKCISDRYEVIGTKIVHKSPVKGLQLSADFGVGVEFLLGRHLGLYVDPSLRYYFDCNQPKSIRTAQPLMLGLEMGLRLKL